MKLILMTDFVLEQQKATASETPLLKPLKKIFNYANFLKQPLTLGMFVPCDLEGNVYMDYRNYKPQKGTVCEPYQGLFEVSRKGENVEFLNEPQLWKDDQRYYNKESYDDALKIYQQALDRVLFEGFEIHVLSDGITKRMTSKDGKFSPCWYNNEKNWYLSNGVSSMVVEDLIEHDLTLTPNAVKQIQ